MNAQQLQQRLEVLDDVLLSIDVGGGIRTQRPLLLDVEIHPVQHIGDAQVVEVGVLRIINIVVRIEEHLLDKVGTVPAVGVVIVERHIIVRREGADPPVVGIHPPRGLAGKLLIFQDALNPAPEGEVKFPRVNRRAEAISVIVILPDLVGKQFIPLLVVRIRDSDVQGLVLAFEIPLIGDAYRITSEYLIGARKGLLNLIGIVIVLIPPEGQAVGEILGSIIKVRESMLSGGQFLVLRNVPTIKHDLTDASADIVPLLRILVALVQRQRDRGIGGDHIAVLLQRRPIPLLLRRNREEGRTGVYVGDVAALLIGGVYDLVANRGSLDVRILRTLHGRDLTASIHVYRAAIFVVPWQLFKAIAGRAALQFGHDGLFILQIGNRIAPTAVVQAFASVQLDVHRRKILVLEPLGQALPDLASREGHGAGEGVDDSTLMTLGAGQGVAGIHSHGCKDLFGVGRIAIIRGHLRFVARGDVIAYRIARRARLNDALSDCIDIPVAVIIVQRLLAEGADPVPPVDAGVPQAVQLNHHRLDLISRSIRQRIAVLVHTLAEEGQHDVRTLREDFLRAVVAPDLVDEDRIAARTGIGEVRAHPVVRMMLADHIRLHLDGGADDEVAPADHTMLELQIVQAALLQRIVVQHALIVVLGQIRDGQLVVLVRDGQFMGFAVRLPILIDGELGDHILSIIGKRRHAANIPGLGDLHVHRARAQVGHDHGGGQFTFRLIVVSDGIDVLGGRAFTNHRIFAGIVDERLIALRLAVGDGHLSQDVVGGIPFGAVGTVFNRRGVVHHLRPLVVLVQLD